ncbi:MAG: hypothetical protein IPM92_13140 [Saprospiraceae bacterium]|nr:hypothetical protein [Saprospiraceae bacterium]
MEISNEVFQTSEKAAMDWLIYASKMKEYRGIPHSRCMCLPEFIAWTSSYPETSGYLIENFLERNIHDPELQYFLVTKTAVWLFEQQSPDGYFYAGLKKQNPSIFNTAQIIGGLHILNKKNQNEEYRDQIIKAYNWCIAQINKDGSWQEGLYVDSWFPVYYVHALWKFIDTDIYYFDGKNLNLLTKSYTYLLDKAQKELYKNCSFYPNTSCLSHTLAYALEGFLECAKLIKDEDTIQWVYKKLREMNERSLGGNKFPAEFHSKTKWDTSYICTTGHAQFASLYYQVYADLKEPWAILTAEQLMHKLINIQYKNKHPGINGAFPASYPIWKPYFPFRIVNWTQKFFLDACWRRRELVVST